MESKEEVRGPVKYITKEKSLVGNEVHEAGVEVMYDGLPAENLEPTCSIGRARYQEYLKSNAERVAKMIEDAKGTDLNKMQQDLMASLAQKQLDAIEAQPAQIAAAVAQAVIAAMAALFPNGAPGAVPSGVVPPADVPQPAPPVDKHPEGGSSAKSAKK
jgi:hypothetical protein